ncbi:S-adenosyl-L-methionine-dependent methyltransferase [Gorgonomyces haynaldii]|nr:S-adenosyl-L-methionine-dependent methyltransferase [Gorgonomyces haynaldii]
MSRLFGGRTLEAEEQVWDANAWDNNEWTEEREQEALLKIKEQEKQPVPLEEVEKYHAQPEHYWDQFYTNNTTKFFKDRNWLRLEFPELFEPKQTEIIELGCGVGNTVYPLLESHPTVHLNCCDYSSVAVQLVKNNPKYDPSRINAFVFDIASPEFPSDIEPESMDVVLCIFVLSALEPKQWQQAAKNIERMLRPGGMLLIRDYGRYDMAQLRFKQGRYLQDNFYIRGDGTRVYFFTNEEIGSMFSLTCLQNDMDRRLLVNRARKLTMFRNWVQAKFQKPIKPTDA